MITTQLIGDAARYVDSRIAKVVLNGTYTITNFAKKSTTGGTVAINYLVPVSGVSLITLIELKDANNVVLSTNPVNVPIAADTMLMQTIEVKEVTS
ncbi:ketopantoate hydroxymethyltransferase [Paenibacillus sp. L3-i20]|uniref:ketopantoate hydroxymethyltransferase n=1 Tax=Paenibacillus sp. L3-i20 TaxID=2905833 RepID=UPI001EDF44EF|nr:ketopantoate hydroxymethyltransferase [Paenibacillus sp. L3-i20]GKU79847.1 hypothetical protein L3i20_v242440 [Paenibacillus sp. L3-i20]